MIQQRAWLGCGLHRLPAGRRRQVWALGGQAGVLVGGTTNRAELQFADEFDSIVRELAEGVQAETRADGAA